MKHNFSTTFFSNNIERACISYFIISVCCIVKICYLLEKNHCSSHNCGEAFQKTVVQNQVANFSGEGTMFWSNLCFAYYEILEPRLDYIWYILV